MVLAIGARVAVKKESPVSLLDCRSYQPAKGYASCGEFAPLLVDVLALGMIHRRQKIGKVSIAGIRPMKLQAVTQQHAGRRAFSHFILLRKQDMKRGQMLVIDDTQRRVE